MVSYPDHVPDTFKTATNAEHVTLHDTTTDAVLALTGRMDSLTLDTLAPDGGSVSGTATVPVRGSDGVWQRALLNLTTSSSSGGSSTGVTDVSSFSGYDASGTTNSNAALSAALTAVQNGASKTLLFRGTPQITQPINITSTLRGLTLRGAGTTYDTTLLWGGTGAMIVLGSDTHPTDRGGSYYDGPQTFIVENLALQPTSAMRTGTLASGSNYAPGTTAIRDWYAGDVRLNNAVIRNFDTGFEGHQSDINNWWNAGIFQCKTGLTLEVRSDQFTAVGLYMFLNERAIDLRGVVGARFYGCQFVGNGSATVNSIAIRQSVDVAARASSSVSFDDCWFEMYQGYSVGLVEAFVEVAIGDTVTSDNINFRNPQVVMNGPGALPRTQHLVKVGNGTAVSIENPGGLWSRLDKLVKCVGSTSPAIKISAAPTTATAYGVLNTGTGSPAFTDNRWAGGGTVSTS